MTRAWLVGCTVASVWPLAMFQASFTHAAGIVVPHATVRAKSSTCIGHVSTSKDASPDRCDGNVASLNVILCIARLYVLHAALSVSRSDWE